MNITKIIVFAFALIILDQITKYLALTYFTEPISILGDFLQFNYSENTGIAFSIPIPAIAIIIINIILIIFIIYIAAKELNLRKTLSQVLTALIIAGGVSNLIDRATRSFVVDFIDIWVYPIFNLADIYITVGVLFMLIFYKKIKHSH